MAEAAAKTRIVRAPVLTLWAAVAAEQLGFDCYDGINVRAGRGGAERLH
jgi:hypothetical protein